MEAVRLGAAAFVWQMAFDVGSKTLQTRGSDDVVFLYRDGVYTPNPSSHA